MVLATFQSVDLWWTGLCSSFQRCQRRRWKRPMDLADCASDPRMVRSSWSTQAWTSRI